MEAGLEFARHMEMLFLDSLIPHFRLSVISIMNAIRNSLWRAALANPRWADTDMDLRDLRKNH